MEQTQVQQLQLQGAVDSLKNVINGLLQENMNLSAQNYILGTQLKEALQKTQELEKLIEASKELPAEASDGSQVA